MPTWHGGAVPDAVVFGTTSALESGPFTAHARRSFDVGQTCAGTEHALDYDAGACTTYDRRSGVARTLSDRVGLNNIDNGQLSAGSSSCPHFREIC